MSEPTAPHRWLDRALVGVFLAGIWLPLLGGVARVGSVATTEKRALAPFPTVTTDREGEPRSLWRGIEAFPRGFQAYYDDHFGFRMQLIGAHNYAKFFWLRSSPLPYIALGLDGWIYFAGQENLENYTHPFEPEELDRWERRFSEVQEWLDDRDIEYLVLFAPSKATIYPEYLPSYERNMQGSLSRLDRMIERLALDTNVRTVDPRKLFRRSKSGPLMYRKHDTHWTDRGGFLASVAVAEALSRDFPAVEPLREEDMREVEFTRRGGDLSGLMSLSRFLSEKEIDIEFPGDPPYRMTEADLLPPRTRRGGRGNDHARATVRDDVEGLPDIVVFHDSNGPELIPFLAAHAQRGVYYWQHFIDPEIIDRERPDVVVHEVGERLLMVESLGRRAPEIYEDFEIRREFRARRRTLLAVAQREITGELPIHSIEAGEDAIVRVDLDLAQPTTLAIRRWTGELVLQRELHLEREIAYGRLDRLEARERLTLSLDPPVPARLLGFEIR